MKVVPSPEWLARTFDTIIEVIDLTSGRLIASLRFPTRPGMVCNSELMYGVEEAQDGDLRVHVLEPQLLRPEGIR